MGVIVCPYCKEGLNKYALVRCVKCNTRHHQVCWLENSNHCSVFSCPGRDSARKKNTANALLVFWCFLNYGLHLMLRLVGEIANVLPLQDVWVVGLLEVVVLATGCIALKLRASSEPLRTFGLMLFACNAMFMSLLTAQYLLHGFERLNAFIRL